MQLHLGLMRQKTNRLRLCRSDMRPSIELSLKVILIGWRGKIVGALTQAEYSQVETVSVDGVG